VALGSLAELETQIIIAEKLHFLDNNCHVIELIKKLRRKLLNFIMSEINNRIIASTHLQGQCQMLRADPFVSCYKTECQLNIKRRRRELLPC